MDLTDDCPAEMEEWLPLPDPDFCYDVSNCGRVRNMWGGDKVLTPYSDQRESGNAYLRVTLTGGFGQRKSFYVHRLVALTFIGPAPVEGGDVNHKDGNGENNCVENLEWATRSENIKHSYLHLRSPRLTEDQLKTAFRLRCAGRTYKDIGEIIGCSHQTAFRYLRARGF